MPKSTIKREPTKSVWGISSRLADDDIEQLAAFYEVQIPVHLGKISDQTKFALGKEIFTNGHPEKGVPPCMACHGEKGEGKGQRHGLVGNMKLT